MNYEQADYLQHYGVLGMKWGQRRARINAVKSSKAKAKGNTEKAAKFAAKSKRIEAKHRGRAGNKAYNRVKKTSTGKLLLQSSLLGTYGALKYNQARAKGNNRGKALVKSILWQTANSASRGVVSVAEPRLNSNKKFRQHVNLSKNVAKKSAQIVKKKVTGK